MNAYILVEDFDDGGSLLIAADVDYGTILQQKEHYDKYSTMKSSFRIAEIEVTNKHLSIK